jgi:asparagine synthase (glutamine-hydrolysing)
MFSFLGSPDGIADFFLDVQSRPSELVRSDWGGARPPWYDIWHALDYKREQLFTESFQPTRSVSIPPDDFGNLVRPDLGDLHPLDAAISIEIETRMPAWTVLVDDRASMANGVETRVPFLDHDLVEWICQLPPEFKLRGLEEKSVLRDAMVGVLRKEVANRKKRSFYSPIKEWFFSKSSPKFVEHYLSEDSLRATGIFNPATVRSHLHELGRIPETSFLRHRLEWLLILVLGCQTLHDRFVKRL